MRDTTLRQLLSPMSQLGGSAAQSGRSLRDSPKDVMERGSLAKMAALSRELIPREHSPVSRQVPLCFLDLTQPGFGGGKRGSIEENWYDQRCTPRNSGRVHVNSVSAKASLLARSRTAIFLEMHGLQRTHPTQSYDKERTQPAIALESLTLAPQVLTEVSSSFASYVSGSDGAQRSLCVPRGLRLEAQENIASFVLRGELEGAPQPLGTH